MKDDMEMSLLGPEGQEGAKKQKKHKGKKYAGPPMETEYVPFDWKKIYAKKYWWIWAVCIIALVLTILIAIFQDKVVEKLRPFSQKVRDLPAGWLIPIVILFILSFPPLVGDEIVEILCGVIYGLWIGFGVVAAGTYFGQIGCWFLFKYALRSKAYKAERTNLNYGALARMVRDGGLWLLILIRISAIPPPMSTAVFSTCDVKFWHFLISTLFSLPRQIFLVYLGTLLVQDKEKNNTPQTIVMIVVLLITLGMGYYLWRKMKVIKVILLEEQEQRRRAKMAMAEGRDEEEGGMEHEWSSSTNDLRNDHYEGGQYAGGQYPGGAARPYDPVPPPAYPQPVGENTAYYGHDGRNSPPNAQYGRTY